MGILSKGCTKDASIIKSTLEEIIKKEDDFFKEVKKLTPAIIFIGETINATNSFN